MTFDFLSLENLDFDEPVRFGPEESEIGFELDDGLLADALRDFVGPPPAETVTL